MGVNFRDASRVERVAEDTFEAQIPDGWQQGRGAFGGLVLGIVVRAARAFESDETRAVRTLSADIAGPVMVGPARVRVRSLRRGQSQTNLQIDVEQEGSVLTSALCTLSAARRVDLAEIPATPPEGARVAWEDAQPFPAGPPLGPVFAKNYEYRNVGVLPFVGAAERPANICYVREKRATGALDAASLVAMLDAPWPTLFSVVRRPYPLATVSFSAQFFPVGEALPAERALYSPGRMAIQHDGYCIELRELWSENRLVAMSQQTIAVLR